MFMEASGFRLIDMIDYISEAGAFLTEDRFGSTYDTKIAPTLIEAFPQLYQYEGHDYYYNLVFSTTGMSINTGLLWSGLVRR